jgi:inner membrane protein
MSDQQELLNSSPAMVNQRPSVFTGLSSSPGFKFIITGVITFLLLIPALLVWALVEERANRADQVAQSISQGWGNQQRINGPYLVVPYMTKQKQHDVYIDVRRYAIFSPSNLDTSSDLDVEERKKSIYSTPLYHMKSKLTGTFDKIDTSQIIARNGRPRLSEAFIAIEVSDLAGFRSEVIAKLNDANEGIFAPGLAGLAPSISHNQYSSQHNATQSNGIHLDINEALLNEEIKFEVDLAINGSRALEIVPSGKTTHVSMTSNWPHPGFNGRFLPETRSITETGFEAKWTVPNLARGISAVTSLN